MSRTMSAPMDMPAPLVCFGNSCPLIRSPGPGAFPHAPPTFVFITQNETPMFPPMFPPCVPFYPRPPFMPRPRFVAPYVPLEPLTITPLDDGSPSTVISENGSQSEEDHQENEPMISNECKALALPALTDMSASFSNCPARFPGIGDIRPFITAILNFKECTGMADEVALRGLPLLLTDVAAMRWQAEKHTVSSWSEAVALLRNTYKVRPSPYKVYRHLFGTHQKEDQSTEVFVKKARALLSQLPPFTLTEDTQLDLVYGLLNRHIREKVDRNDCNSFADLLRLANIAEMSIEQAQRPDAPESAAEAMPDGDVGDNSKDPCQNCKTFGQLLVRMCQKIHKKNAKETGTENMEAEENKQKKEEYKGPASKMRCFYCLSPNIVRMKCLDCILLTRLGAPLKPKARPVLTVNIYGLNFDMVVDTGARNCIATPALTEHLVANQQEFTSDDLDLTTREGSSLRQVMSIAAVDVWVAGVIVRTSFINFPRATENVLGMDFILDAGLVIDFRRNGQWSLRDMMGFRPVTFEKITPIDNEN
ncbi:uncharacterized protein LOC113493330 [Trichoplusia ni]|uniref:Uncharacterized protein LOC113493330 n=1 Tax=Trichoplusia ni TaxID=7111 RepID=A0A7E5VFJ4_TRINI|nr:uncharacterized protein LOC113493330 [Trichoplusia ni]